MEPSVRMLWSLSAILISTTLMSDDMDSRSLRKFSAWIDALSPKIPPEIFVRPSTMSAIFFPNEFSMSSRVNSVSSITSWSNAAHIDVEPRPSSETTILATAMGCNM